MTLRNKLKDLIIPQPKQANFPVAPGLYHYMKESGQETYSSGAYTRFHLRVDPDGSGMLIANATVAARLSPTGILIAHGLLEGKEEAEIYDDLGNFFFGATRNRMQNDLESVAGLLAYLVSPGDNYPILNFNDADLSPYHSRLMAPLQADLAIAEPQTTVAIIDKLWKAAIPHVVIRTHEKFNHAHLVRAVERAEDLGMITGIRGLSTHVADARLLEELALAGLDHVTIPFAGDSSEVHDFYLCQGDFVNARSLISMIQSVEVEPVAEILLTSRTVLHIDNTIRLLQNLGVSNFNFFAISTRESNEGGGSVDDEAIKASAMAQAAELVEEMANQLEARFVWLPPSERDPNQSLSRQIQTGPRCSSDLAIKVDGEGNVFPPRGRPKVAGNLFADSWEEIWVDEVFLAYRERVEQPTRCDECPDLAICAIDCPRKPKSWALINGGSE